MNNIIKKAFYALGGLKGLAILLIALLISFFLVKSCVRDRIDDLIPKEKPIVEKKDLEARKVDEKKDNDGRAITDYEPSNPIKNWEEIHDRDKNKIDSLLKVVDLERKKVKSITAINAQLKEEGLILKKKITERGVEHEYKDRWLTNTIYQIDSIYYSDLEIDASVNKVDYNYKKYWVFGRNTTRSKVWFNNPHIKSTGLEYVTVEQKEPFLGIGLDLEGKYLHESKEILIGPKIDLKIGRFNINGGYYLNPGGKVGNTFWYGGGYKIY